MIDLVWLFISLTGWIVAILWWGTASERKKTSNLWEKSSGDWETIANRWEKTSGIWEKVAGDWEKTASLVAPSDSMVNLPPANENKGI